jgi:hypothetical protein
MRGRERKAWLITKKITHLFSDYLYIALDLYFLPSIIRMIKPRRMRWAGHVARMGKKRNMYRLLVGKSEGKRPLERPRYRWMDNIKMGIGEVGWHNGNWIGLA